MKFETSPAPSLRTMVTVPPEAFPALTSEERVLTMRRSLLPLAMLPEGSEALVVGLHCGRGLTRRLAELGFTPDTVVKMLKVRPPGPVLIEVRGSKIALGRGIAMKILVDPVTY